MLQDKILVILKKFWKFKIWVIAIPLVAASIVFFLTRHQERKYISTATLQVNLPTTGEVSLTGREFKQYEASLFFYDLIEVIKSRKTIEMVRLEVLKQHLEGKYDLFSFEKDPILVNDTSNIYKRVKILRENYSLLNLMDTIDISITVLLENNRLSLKEMQGQLKTYRVGKSNYVDIVVETENPYKSAFLNSCYLEIIAEQYKIVSQKNIQNNKQRLEDLVKLAKEELDQKINNLEGFKIDNKIINLTEHTKAIVNQIVNMEVKLAHLRETYAAHAKASEATKERLKFAKDLNFNDQSNKRIVKLKDSLKNIHNQLLYFEGEDDEKNSLNNNAESLKNEIITSISNMVQKVPYDPSQARQELLMRYIGYEIDKEMESIMIPAVENELARLNAYAAKFAPLESNIGTLSSEIHTAQESYLILLSKLNMVRVMEQGSSDVKISTFSPPTLPRKPERSKRLFMIIGVFIASSVMIAAGIIGFVLLDKKVYTAKYFTELTNIQPTITLHEKKDFSQEVKRLRKKIIELPVELRAILITGFSETDVESGFSNQIINSLKAFPGKVCFLNASGTQEEVHDFKVVDLEEIKAEENQHQLIKWEDDASPFEIHSPDKWNENFQERLKHNNSLIISAKPAKNNADWEEWLGLAHGVIMVRHGGQHIKEKELAFIDTINRSGKSLISNVFIEKNQ